MSRPKGSHRFCVAPMMGHTDRHGRYLLRLLSRRARLYTEMIPVNALIHGDAGRALRFDPAEHPVACQLGGGDPAALARAARLVEQASYDEVNLNIGCPSERVQRGCFGAALMTRPTLVADCIRAMRAAGSLPVTAKIRIGFDDHDSYEWFRDFAGLLIEAGSDTLIVHARKAWLKGLNPKQNREIPTLRPDWVYRLKRELPHARVVLNGNLATVEDARTALRGVDGVMFGRAACRDPWLLASVDEALFGDAPSPHSRFEVVERYLAYVARQRDARLSELARPLFGLFRGRPGARDWRRALGELACRRDADPGTLARECARITAALHSREIATQDMEETMGQAGALAAG